MGKVMGAKNAMRRDIDDERPSRRASARSNPRGGVGRVFVSTRREFHRIGRRLRCYKNPRETIETREINQSMTMTSPT